MLELARLTDSIELAGVGDLYAAAAAAAPAAGVFRAHSDGALIAALANVPSAVYSRVIGLGLEGEVTPEALDRVLAEVRRSRAPRAFVHLSPYARPQTLPSLLEARGLVRHPRSWMRFVREREPPPDARTDFTIRLAHAGEAEQVDQIVRDAFGIPEAGRGVFGSVVGRPRWHVFVAVHGERLVGAAGLFTHDDAGWCGFGCVASDMRRRGGQSALLRARIELGLELGCRVLFSETGEAAPGDPQHSYKNLLRAGFREAFSRPNYLLTSEP